MKTTPRITIVMPCLNEAETLEICIKKARHFFAAEKIIGEIIVADNGSTDGSQEIAERAGARVIHVSQKGYGSALMGGFEAAQSDYIIMGDADDSYDFSNLQDFINTLDEGCDLVMGNRFKGGIMRGAMPFLHRYLGNPVLSGIARLFFKSDIGDFHCGLRAFRKDAILKLNLQTTGMEFASEMIVKATMRGLKIKEVATILYPDGRTRPPHLRTWTDGWRHLRFLLLYSPRWLFFYPGIVLTVLGILLSAFLLGGPRHIGRITLDINTLMYAAFLIILGVQAVLFSLFTYVFGVNADLLPKDDLTDKFVKNIGLEKGIVISFGMILLGFVSSVGALIYWGENLFGNIDPTFSMRLVIPGAVLSTLGFQTFFASFFLSILNTRLK
ncbi:MAG: glycosyltransferase family 2 protein [Anaerolineales bacterium]|jgi:glycosyltransferase involved in cell wall biosynthesis|nr:glycosyltransferase family 2 protein [Anaerolineales bacterium]MBK8821307.1 glycosyltransferase family 2 protein [Anaerolineales bacterium]